ncbi:MAG TPA: A/G-specific adenine glycosylase [Acidobacteriaceae bacterium]|jgi:A/G-specific adenine glycosylase|nr:A/G-specific adenine glycosylase [Acidobacteriaceae bacterium]
MESAVLEEQQLRTFRQALLWWYSLHARDLPWRRTQDPYCIWISEIMLQQTRVAAVVERYKIFVERFPSLLALALAGEDEILAVWSGLGYYKRARLLHRAAQFVLREHAGTLPQSADALRKLPGIGAYTAAAVASIAFNEPVAVVDGNVERVVTRVLGMAGSGKQPSPSLLRKAADRLLATEKPGTFNQAMMELGATICLPQNPLCMQCPVMEICRTQGEHPVARRKQMRSRLIAYGLVRRQEKQQGKLEVLLQQRPANASQMPGMWELLEVDESIVENIEPVLRVRHAITNTNHYVRVYDFDLPTENMLQKHETQRWANADTLLALPLTGLARKILMRMDILPRPKTIRTGREIPAAFDPFLL